jgi:hypothetical protein
VSEQWWKSDPKVEDDWWRSDPLAETAVAEAPQPAERAFSIDEAEALQSWRRGEGELHSAVRWHGIRPVGLGDVQPRYQPEYAPPATRPPPSKLPMVETTPA